MGVKVREKVKGSGVWWVFISHGGRRTSRKVGSEKAALEVARKIQAKLTLEEALPERKPPTPILADYYLGFKNNYMATTLKHSSYLSYENAFRLHILPKLGALHLDQITRPKMEEFVAGLIQKDFSKHYIRLILASLGTLCQRAVEHDILTVSPVRNLGKFYRRAPTRNADIQPLNRQEVQLFLKTVVTHFPGYYPFFLTALHTGLRPGELMALKWGDFDFNGKFLLVRRSFTKGRMTDTKIGRAHRVDVSDTLIEVLLELRRKRQEEWLAKGVNQIPDLVFYSNSGEPKYMHSQFKTCLRRAGLRALRLHDLRHTYASLLLAQGAPITYVSSQLGHADSRTTLCIYAHWVVNKNQRENINQLPSLRDPVLSVEDSEEERIL